MVCSGINEPVRTAFAEYIDRRCGCSLAAYLDFLIDIQTVSPEYIGPPLAPNTDIWGVRRAAVNYGQGFYHEIEYYPLAKATCADDIIGHPWPSPDFFDYSTIPQQIHTIQKKGERCIMVANGNIFETSWYMRGFEQIFLDMAENPALAHEILQRVADFYVEYFRRALAAGRGEIDLVFTADDIGGQNGLLMSLAMWKQFIQLHHQ